MASEPINTLKTPGRSCHCLLCLLLRAELEAENKKPTHVWITDTGNSAYQSRAKALTYLRDCHKRAVDSHGYGLPPSKITVKGELCFYHYCGHRISIKKLEVLI